MNLKHLTKDVGRFLTENSPQILTALGVAGVAATAYFTHKAAVQSTEVVFRENNLRSEKDGSHAVYLTRREEIEKVWKLYIPAVTTGVMTVGCIVAANRVQARRMAALAAAYGVLSGDFDEFRNKALEKLGMKKVDEVNTELAKKKIEGNLPPNVVLGDGKTWFCDAASERIFPSTMETIKAGMNKVNYQVNNQKDATLNDFYDAIGIKETSVGDILGWNSGKKCDIDFSSVLTDTHGAVTVFTFASGPFPNY